mmetsp:Transcript_10084/g.15183  ORF Transcript_10084/g.15183 Transcript_10084/m.15183 type:complete len:150 (+) Transcript_10084:164-613(+)
MSNGVLNQSSRYTPNSSKMMNGFSSAVSTPHNGSMNSPRLDLLDSTPDSIICSTLHIKGRLQYRELLRIDGSFEGQLISEGSLIVGPNGRLVSQIVGLDEVLIDGGMAEGSVNCKTLILRCGAKILGDITCKSLSLDGSCSVKGTITVL